MPKRVVSSIFKVLTRGRSVVTNSANCLVFHGEKYAKNFFLKNVPMGEIDANFDDHMKILTTFFVLVISRARKIFWP